MIVKLRRKNPRYRELTARQPYPVIGIEANDFRVLNDAGRPYLYPRQIFVMVDAHEPTDWVVKHGEDDERYAYPPPLNTPGFFEDFFDEKPKAVRTFWRIMNQQLAAVGWVDSLMPPEETRTCKSRHSTEGSQVIEKPLPLRRIRMTR